MNRRARAPGLACCLALLAPWAGAADAPAFSGRLQVVIDAAPPCKDAVGRCRSTKRPDVDMPYAAGDRVYFATPKLRTADALPLWIRRRGVALPLVLPLPPQPGPAAVALRIGFAETTDADGAVPAQITLELRGRSGAQLIADQDRLLEIGRWLSLTGSAPGDDVPPVWLRLLPTGDKEPSSP